MDGKGGSFYSQAAVWDGDPTMFQVPLGNPRICPYVMSQTFYFLNTTWLCYFLKGAQLTKSMGKGTNPLFPAIQATNF